MYETIWTVLPRPMFEIKFFHKVTGLASIYDDGRNRDQYGNLPISSANIQLCCLYQVLDSQFTPSI